MILANESLLMLVAFIGIAGIVVIAVGNNYEDTIQSIDRISSSRNAKIAESIDILDVQNDNGELYIILSNRSDETATFSHFLDDDGDDAGCKKGETNNLLGSDNPLEIKAGSTSTIRCTPSDESDVVLVTIHYNIIRIENPNRQESNNLIPHENSAP